MQQEMDRARAGPGPAARPVPAHPRDDSMPVSSVGMRPMTLSSFTAQGYFAQPEAAYADTGYEKYGDGETLTAYQNFNNVYNHGDNVENDGYFAGYGISSGPMRKDSSDQHPQRTHETQFGPDVDTGSTLAKLNYTSAEVVLMPVLSPALEDVNLNCRNTESSNAGTIKPRRGRGGSIKRMLTITKANSEVVREEEVSDHDGEDRTHLPWPANAGSDGPFRYQDQWRKWRMYKGKLEDSGDPVSLVKLGQDVTDEFDEEDVPVWFHGKTPRVECEARLDAAGGGDGLF